MAILAAILFPVFARLFPVFARARGNARLAGCLSNLKQLDMGTLQYSHDYDEKLVPYRVAGGTGGGTSWPDIVFPYIKSTQLFTCPGATGDGHTYNPRNRAAIARRQQRDGTQIPRRLVASAREQFCRGDIGFVCGSG